MSEFTFYLGTHMPSQRWFDLEVPLFISRRRMLARKETTLRKKMPTAKTRWALDSGGFTELSLFGGWRTTVEQYVRDVVRLRDEIGMLDWVAPQDWMCEPFMLDKTGGSVEIHQRLTVDNFLELRQELGELVIPVLQGWSQESYLWCWEMYDEAGVDLEAERIVGLGSVCRRQNTFEAEQIVRSLSDARLHYFGAKITGLEAFDDALASADSLAWSYDGRRLKTRCPEGNKSCSNCMHHALEWRNRLLNSPRQLRLEVLV